MNNKTKKPFDNSRDNVMLLINARIRELKEQCLQHRYYIEARLTEAQRKRMNGKDLLQFKAMESINTITKDVDMKLNWGDLIIKTRELESFTTTANYLEERMS